VNRPRLAGRGARSARAIFALGAAALLLGMAAKAALDVSWAWDVWYYHLPFAGRIWGVLPASAYILTPLDEARYQGYPLLAEALQGLAWKISGRPEAANFIAFFALLSLVAYARLRLGAPWYLTTLALLAVPLVQIHATSCYIDLPANAALALVVLEAMRATVSPPGRRALAVVLAAAVLTGNMRLQLEPLVLAALAVIAFSVRRSRGKLAALVLALPLVFASPLKNLVVHHNPAYPVALHVAGHELPFAEEPYDSSPPYLEHTPRPWRWLVSLAEVGIQPLEESRRWTIDQYMPPDSRGNRMGGFFGAYVAVNLLALALLAWRARRRPETRRLGRAAVSGVLVLSLACSLMPQSHELRYYLVWMLVLVLINVGLVARLAAKADLRLELGAALVASGFVAVVLASTRGWHVTPQRYPFEALVRDHVDPAVLAGAAEGSTICVARPPWTALYAAPFHPPRRYAVREVELPEDCAPAGSPAPPPP
jgi:hypothetical protein